jgi:hypothetical protein
LKFIKHRHMAGFSDGTATKKCYETEMDMAKPKGMFLRGLTWWARKDVPKELQKIVGKTSLQKTLGTSDFAMAKITFHSVMAEFEAIIAWARKQASGEAAEGLVVELGSGLNCTSK